MKPATRIVAYQGAVALVMAVALAPLGRAQSLAALIAGLVVLVPNAYFAWRAGVEPSPTRLLAHGVGRSVATLVLMAAAFAVTRPAPLGFFAALIVMQLMYLVGSGPTVRSGSGAARDADTDA